MLRGSRTPAPPGRNRTMAGAIAARQGRRAGVAARGSARSARRGPLVATGFARLFRRMVRNGKSPVLVAVFVERVVERLEEGFLLMFVVLIDLRFRQVGDGSIGHGKLRGWRPDL